MNDQTTITEATIEPQSVEPKAPTPDSATYDTRAHNALPGVDVRGSYPHRPAP